MGILVITVDLDCCRCKDKITKVLDCLKGEFAIEKVEFEDKNKKVVVRGKYDAEKLCKAVWCKAHKVVKEIVIVEVWPIPPPPKPCKPDPPCKPADKCGCCCQCKPCCKVKPDKCDCEHCKPKPKPEEKPKPKPEEKPKPKTEYKLVPYPYPLPWPCQCPPHQQCQCPRPPPPPQPPKPCSCSNHGNCGCGGGTPPVWPWPPHPPVWPQQPPVWPPPWAGCNVVADENQCSVM